MAFLGENPRAVSHGLRLTLPPARLLPQDGPQLGMAQALRALIADPRAEAATVLWTQLLKFDAADPHWHDRDRFVLSDAQAGGLLHAVLHLTGHADVDHLQLRRMPGRACALTPREAAGVAALPPTNMPAGQGFGQAVGMALAERALAARFGRSLVDHRIWVLAAADELMSGVSQEAAGLAGQLRLEKLTLLFEDRASEDANLNAGEPALPGLGGDDILRRFLAQGWAVQRTDAHDMADIEAALSFAMRAKKPTVIALQTRAIASGTGLACGGTPPRLSVPDHLSAAWEAAGARGAVARRAWLKRVARHPQRGEFERVMSGRLPDDLHERLAALRGGIAVQRPRVTTVRASLKVQEAVNTCLPELLAGAAGSDAAQAQPPGMAAIGPGQFGGRFLFYGMREHAMAAAMNGIALHGGLIPAGVMHLAFSDYLRPALRLACLIGRRVIHVMVEDATGEDSAAGQPVEQLAALRTIPGLLVFRPADALEAAEAWDLALRRSDGPSVLVLSRQPAPTWRSDPAENRTARGGYVLAEAEGARKATLIASGPEVTTAMTARAVLAEEGIGVAVVSLPCWELFAQADAAYRLRVLGGVPRFGIEAGSGFGWERWLGDVGIFLGFGGYGTSASCQDLYEHVPVVPEAIVAAVKKRLANPAQLEG